MREGECYKLFESGKCKNPQEKRITRAACCCTNGAAWSWGREPCLVCPESHEGKLTFPALLIGISLILPPWSEGDFSRQFNKAVTYMGTNIPSQKFKCNYT